MKYIYLPLFNLLYLVQEIKVDMSLKTKRNCRLYCQNNLTAQKRFCLYYVIKEAGDGVKPTSSIVTVAYKGYYTDGRF
jgi:hypothetical protein